MNLPVQGHSLYLEEYLTAASILTLSKYEGE